MAWRVVEVDRTRWKVSIAAERRAPAETWSLVLSFRPEDAARRAFWTTYPITCTSRAAVYAQAEKISDDRLAELVVRHEAP